MGSQPKSKTPVVVGLLLFVSTGIFALFFLFGGEPPPPPGTVVRDSPTDEEPTLPPSALLAEELMRREEEEEEARRSATGSRIMIQSDAMTSELLARGRQPLGAQGVPPAQEEADSAGPRRSMPRADQASGYEESPDGWSLIKLSAAEQAQLDAMGAGMKTPNEAFALGKDQVLFKKVIEQVGRHPKLVKYLLDNEYVVKGFMSRPRAQRNCNNKGAAMAHYSNPGASESGLALTALNTMLKGHSETPSALGSSKMMGAFLKCPALQQIINDPDALGTIIDKNPIAAKMLQDPAILKGMTGSPELMGAYMGAQAKQAGR